MRRVLLDDDQPATPVEDALTRAGWSDVKVSARPAWLVMEERLWRAATADSTSPPGMDALKAEGAELLPAMPYIQRSIATALRR
jgi:hypothetical protein